MAKARNHGARRDDSHPGAAPGPSEEDRSLLTDDPLSHEYHNDRQAGYSAGPRDDYFVPPKQQSAAPLRQALRSPGTPRTPNRVRFDPIPSIVQPSPPRPSMTNSNGSRSSRDSFDVDDDEIFQHAPGYDDHDDHHRLPLLTDIEAPSVALANSQWGEDVHEWAETELNRPKSGLKMAFMNMANSIIGAGIIGQPYAFKQAGMLGGIILLLGLTIVVDWTICLIVVNSKLSGSNSFQGTVEHCFGRTGLIAISVAQWAFAFGGMVAFGIIVGDSIPHVLTAIWPDLREMPVLGLLANRQVVIVVFVLGISYPLTLYRDIAKLAKASTLALISMGVIVATVVIQGALTPKADRGSFTPALLTVNSGIFEAIGVISFDRFSRVTHYSVGISTVACLIVALAGFLTFGDKTLGNVLNNFPADNVMVTIARLCFGLNMLTTLPLEAFVCREVMFNYFFPGEPFNMNLHLIFSSSLVVSAMIMSLVTCDVGAVFELVGATSACAIAYILPPLCYIKLSSRSWKTYVAGGIVVFGTVVMVITLIQAVAKMISNDSGPAKCM
ncbi:hypothetical protein CBS470a_004430 [Colletotrichum nupharicola]|nr:hypothetical protein CBS470a_004430 [Colletotrichum nupharicola]